MSFSFNPLISSFLTKVCFNLRRVHDKIAAHLTPRLTNKVKKKKKKSYDVNYDIFSYNCLCFSAALISNG